MKKTLRNILFGTALLGSVAGCDAANPRPDYSEANWIQVPYEGQIWDSYMAENIVKSKSNWAEYQWVVGVKNGQGDYLENFKGKTILLPDIDGDGSVTSGKNKFRSTQ
jgi:hypothetical protein